MKITVDNFITDEMTNKVYISNLINKKSSGFENDAATELESCIKTFCPNFELLFNTKDVWARDYMPIQLTKDIYLSFTYKPDYLAENPKYVTNWQMHKVHANGQLNFIFVQMPIILDGGNVVKAILENQPCMILCDKVLLENNMTEIAFRDWWKHWWRENFSGTEMKLVLLPWEGKRLNPIGHADGMVRYIGEGRVLMTNYLDFDKKHGEKIKSALEAAFGQKNVKTLGYTKIFKDDEEFNNLISESWCYINYLQVSNRILIPSLGYNPLDQEAARQIGNAFNMKIQVETINADMTSIVKDPKNDENSGGALNCLTWTTME